MRPFGRPRTLCQHLQRRPLLFTKDGQTVPHVNGNPIPTRRRSGDIPTLATAPTHATIRRVFYFADQIIDAHSGIVRSLDSPYASDSGHVYWMGKPSTARDPNTFRVLNADFQCSADDTHAYYRRTFIANADRRTFPPDPAVTNCAEKSILFSE